MKKENGEIVCDECGQSLGSFKSDCLKHYCTSCSFKHNVFRSFGDVHSNIHNTRETLENIFLKRIDELDQKLELILKKLR